MKRTANFKAVWRLNHAENAKTNMFFCKFRSNDFSSHVNRRFVKWTPRKWSINWKCRISLRGEHNGLFLQILCDFYHFPLFYSQRIQERKGSHNLHCQGSVNIKGHIIKFALVQGPLCACSVYRLLTEILRVAVEVSAYAAMPLQYSFLIQTDKRRAEFWFYPFSTRLWRELIPRLWR
jgi:hypothetical protein